MDNMSSNGIGQTLRAAIEALRVQAGDPTALVVVVSPSEANGVLLRKALARTGAGFIRVRFTTPESIVDELAALGLAASGLAPEPSGWLRTTLQAFADDEPLALGRYAKVLARPGWAGVLESAVSRLERAGVGTADLRAVGGSRPELLAAFLEAAVAARSLDGVAGPAAVQDAARSSLGSGNAPLDRAAAAIVVGDRELDAPVHDLLRDWLRARPARRVAFLLDEEVPAS